MHLSDALGTLRPVTWGTLRVKRATRPLRYAAPLGPPLAGYRQLRNNEQKHKNRYFVVL